MKIFKTLAATFISFGILLAPCLGNAASESSPETRTLNKYPRGTPEPLPYKNAPNWSNAMQPGLGEAVAKSTQNQSTPPTPPKVDPSNTTQK